MTRENPIIVVGSQRSGTTLLQATLGRHSRIAAAPEFYFWIRIYLIQDELGSLEDDDNLVAVVTRAVDVPLGLWDETGVTVDAVVERMKAEGRRDYRSLYNAIMSEFAAVHRKARWSEKTPGQQVAHGLRMAPNAQIIHIVRRVEDVVASNLVLPWQTDNPYAIGLNWGRFNSRCLQAGLAAGPDTYLQIRYENLVRSPEETLTHICDFLGESFEPPMLEATPSVAVSESGRTWQAQAEQAITRPTRRHLGRLQKLQVRAATRQVAPTFGDRSEVSSRGLDALAVLVSPALRLREHMRSWRDQRSSSPSTVTLETVDRFLSEAHRNAVAPDGEGRVRGDR